MTLKFSEGTEIRSLNNARIIIEKKLGEGGQGIVYKITHNGKAKALKVYKQGVFTNSDAFYKNLCDNVKKGSPSKGTPNDCFLWPEDILSWTDTPEGKTFGYIMDLRPPEYKELSEYLAGAVKFPSFKSRTMAAIEICTAFRILHSQGYSYQDLNDGNFFIIPGSGKVLICDNDNVAPNNTHSGILGKPRYMAPEIVRGETLPNTHTDRFSLAVIIFLLLTQTHPLEGALYLCPCLTDDVEKKLYGTNPIFIMHPTDHRNGAVRGIHNNIIKVWPEMPQYMKDAFLKAFTGEALTNPQRRMTEQEWERVLIHFYSDIIRCYCGNEIFTWNKNAPRCDSCGRLFNNFNMLKISGGNYEIPLIPGNVIFREQLGTANIGEGTKPVIKVVQNPADKKLYLQNISGKQITCITPTARQVPVADQGLAPANEGLGFKFDNCIITVVK